MPWIVVLLFAAGLFLTIRYRFVQIVRFPEAVRETFGEASTQTTGALTPFQAFMVGLIGLSGLVAALLAARRAPSDPPAPRA